jgi:hypothetical protein
MKQTINTAIDKGEFIKRTREGIKLEIATRVFSELIGQAARGNRLVPGLMDVSAATAFQCANAFMDELEKQEQTL